MLLELGFAYDTKTKVIGYFDPVANKLQVLGLSSCEEYRLGWHRPDGGMVLAFYEHANAEVLANTDGSVGDFCDQLRLAYRHVERGEAFPTWLSSWFQEIDPYIEDFSLNKPVIKVGTAIRFYCEDGPRSSWVWKDTVKEISVVLRPSPVRVEH